MDVVDFLAPVPTERTRRAAAWNPPFDSFDNAGSGISLMLETGFPIQRRNAWQ
jgi:hypothetical protein